MDETNPLKSIKSQCSIEPFRWTKFPLEHKMFSVHFNKQNPSKQQLQFFLNHFPDYKFVTNFDGTSIENLIPQDRKTEVVCILDLSKQANLNYPFCNTIVDMMDSTSYLITFGSFCGPFKNIEEINSLNNQIMDNANFIIFFDWEDLREYIKFQRNLELSCSEKLEGLFLIDTHSIDLTIYKLDGRIVQ